MAKKNHGAPGIDGVTRFGERMRRGCADCEKSRTLSTSVSGAPKTARGKYVLLLNTDAIDIDRGVGQMVNFLVPHPAISLSA